MLALKIDLVYVSHQSFKEFNIIFLACGCGKTSFNFLGFLSSKINSEYHLKLNADIINSIGRVSLPFSVRFHITIIVEILFSCLHLMNPSFSSSLRRIESTLGVSPGIDSKIRLKRLIFRKPISLKINMVHFLPNTPKLVLIGHLIKLILGNRTSSACSFGKSNL